MTSLWQPGQLLFCGFVGEVVPRELRELIAQGRVGGVILFARNLKEPRQIRQLVQDLHGSAPKEAPLLIAIDQEGGRVQRLREPWTVWPPMKNLGRHGDEELTKDFASALAKELGDLGIHLNFAPVVDVDTNPLNPIIGDRSFSADPQVVARHSAAFIRGLQGAGVAACAKHFPGHGDTLQDSHLELPVLPHGRERLEQVELVPFKAAIAADVATIMTAHVVFEALDAKIPATLSHLAMNLLREELGFGGVIFSDDLEMKALANHMNWRDRVHGCMHAGVDALLVCEHADARDETLALLERMPDAQVERAIDRVVALKQRYARKPADAQRSEEANAPQDQSENGPPYAEHKILAARFAK